MIDSIAIAPSIAQSREPRRFSAVEPRKTSELVEGDRAQAVALGIVEEPGEFFGGRFFSQCRSSRRAQDSDRAVR
jgi:hypothetical protein